MATHAHGAGESWSPATITAVCGGAAALITAIGAAIGVFNHPGGDPQGPMPTISTAAAIPAPTATSLPNLPDTGLRFSPLINGKLTVSGSTQKDINGMYVMIGPKPSGQYDTGCGNVVDQRWQADVATDGSWATYPLSTVPAYGPCAGATSTGTHPFVFRGTDPSPTAPPADQILDCVKQNGPACFNRPGFGPPTVYQPNR